jgi:D-alanyl-D-alanine endopeptidase (penicillin-binding protein 7)
VPFTSTPESYLIADSNGVTIKEQDSELQRPIASISKLMVGLLASAQDLKEELLIPSKRAVSSSIPNKQKTLPRIELLTLALVKSDNFAAQILCENIPNCISAMNTRAQELGMLRTYYEEPTGLSKNNVSTANDLLKLLMVAASNTTITSVSSLSTASVDTGNKSITIKNTNPLTAKMDIVLSKTGFTNPAGQCLIMGVRSPVGVKYFILLGSKHRIPEMERLYKDVS